MECFNPILLFERNSVTSRSTVLCEILNLLFKLIKYFNAVRLSCFSDITELIFFLEMQLLSTSGECMQAIQRAHSLVVLNYSKA